MHAHTYLVGYKLLGTLPSDPAKGQKSKVEVNFSIHLFKAQRLLEIGSYWTEGPILLTEMWETGEHMRTGGICI